MRGALGVRRAQLLSAVLDLDSHLSRHVGRALADDFADFPHGRKLLGELHVLTAILAADAAAGLFGVGLRPVLAPAFRLGVLRILAFVSGLAVLRIGLLAVT